MQEKEHTKPTKGKGGETLKNILDSKFGQELGKELGRLLVDAVIPRALNRNTIEQEVLKGQVADIRSAFNNIKNPYRTLGVMEDVDNEVVKAVYKAKAKKLHPDKPGGSQEKMTELNAAYSEICKKRGIKP